MAPRLCVQHTEMSPQPRKQDYLQCSQIVHRHGRSVALQLPHLAMGDSSGGTDGFAFFPGFVGCSQAHNEFFNQFRKISGMLVVT